MNISADKLIAYVDAERLKNLIVDLVCIPSPTGESFKASKFLADYLIKLGLDTQMDTTMPNAPNVTSLIRGGLAGPRLTMLGHIDTISRMGHPEPYIKDDMVYGRGSADMKFGIAAMAETARILVENEVKFNGELLLATHSFHEAPVGKCEGLLKMLKDKIFGDAAIVLEGPDDYINITGKGLCLYQIKIQTSGESIHETSGQNLLNPIIIANNLLNLFNERNEYWAKKKYEYLGSQTLFMGMIHSGDFYNRLPKDCTITGTVRFGPDKNYNDIEKELNEIIGKLNNTDEINIKLKIDRLGLGYNIDKDMEIVKSLSDAFVKIKNCAVSYGGSTVVTDVDKIVVVGGIPTVGFGVGFKYAHADLERVSVSDAVTVTKILLLTILNYFKYKQ
ncbi:MAG: M20/M25/M40 family metallo-hydrolase [Actinobacteria bacterium]|nr:M20/M25/M40 family metallo-hydrolase [Actinomycetota bacterium]